MNIQKETRAIAQCLHNMFKVLASVFSTPPKEPKHMNKQKTNENIREERAEEEKAVKRCKA